MVNQGTTESSDFRRLRITGMLIVYYRYTYAQIFLIFLQVRHATRSLPTLSRIGREKII
jgi:hypothetical protein